MNPDKILFTTLQSIHDKSRITSKKRPIFISQSSMVAMGFDADDIASTMALLRDDLKCIRILEWPTRKRGPRLDVFLTAIGRVVETDITPRDNYKIRLMPKFPSVYDSYKQKGRNINDPGHRATHQDKKMAALRFANYSTPEVTVEGKSYSLASMRNGNAFNIVEHCLRLHPGEVVTLEKLKAGLKLGGVGNINSALQKSPFDKNNGLLRMFVVSSPKAITVSPTALLDDSQLEAIEQSIKTLE